MNGLTLHSMKEICVILASEHRAFVTDLFDNVNATGYTIISNVSGKGHHGVREAHFMFNEQEILVMIITVVPEEKGQRTVKSTLRLSVRYGALDAF